MGRIKRPTYTRAVPAGAIVREIKGKQFATLTIRGESRACEVRQIRGRLRAVVELLDRWAIEWRDETGAVHARTIRGDKRMATAALARYEERAARLRHGLPDLVADARARGRPIVQVIEEYIAVLAGGDTAPGYRQHMRARLLAITAGCRWETWADVEADALARYLGRLRDGPDGGRSLSTLNGYLRCAKVFCNWYAERLKERSPLKGLKGYPEQKERRRSRRILTDDEFGRLLEAAEKAPRRFRAAFSGKDRAMLYRVAAYSGLRASELARLTPQHFRLAADNPSIVVYGKGKREEATPIPEHLAALLRSWLAGRKPTVRVWPGRWSESRHQAAWIERDAKRAGLGPGVTFHGLRRRFVTSLIRAKNDPDVVRRMARHVDLKTTMDYYAELTPGDLRRAAESLQPPRAG